MTAAIATRPTIGRHVNVAGDWLPGARFDKIREVIDLIAAIGNLTDPISSEPGLRTAIELVVRFAELIGIDPSWTARLRDALDDEGVFYIVLAVVRFALGLMDTKVDFEGEGATVVLASEDGSCVLTTQSFLSWLPIVLQLIQLIRGLRGER
ncbi:MAG: hypothetical protein KDA63_17965 [Planctomycetales bacterium]|nr:hypothetical protein [Planctomycetales bacterium]